MIEIHALCHQEAKIIPFFMRHYTQYGQVILYEGHSTDGSRDLARSLGATVIDFDTDNQVRDDLFTELKNTCWKGSTADWVMVVDMDEFIYHPDMIQFLKTINESVIVPAYFEMLHDEFPKVEPSQQLYDVVQMGFPIKPKISVFKPRKIKNTNYGAGMHDALPEGDVSILKNSGVMCFHMRHLGIDNVARRNAYLWGRQSQQNLDNRWGWHVSIPKEEIQKYFDDHRRDCVNVMGLVK